MIRLMIELPLNAGLKSRDPPPHGSAT